MITKQLIGLAAFLVFTSKGQTVTPTVLASDGGHSQGSGGSISWTIGEPISETYSSSSNITTMGFHQPVIGLADMIAEQGNEAALLVYPNPVIDELRINFSGIKEGEYSLEIIDALGKLIYRSQTSVSKSSPTKIIKVNEYASGAYFLVISGDSFRKSIKISKTN